VIHCSFLRRGPSQADIPITKTVAKFTFPSIGNGLAHELCGQHRPTHPV
jgi:hypothetical protein